MAVVVFIVMAWQSDIKPRIFSNPDAVKLKSEFKLGILIYLACFCVAFILFLVLLAVAPQPQGSVFALGIIFAGLALVSGNFFFKRCIRRTFYEVSIANRMNPEEYAKTLCPDYVVRYIETHLTDKEALEKYIKQQKRLGRISDPCAWAFLVAYCDKEP